MSKIDEYNRAKELLQATKELHDDRGFARELKNVTVKARATNDDWVEANITLQIFGYPVFTRGITHEEAEERDKELTSVFEFLGQAIKTNFAQLIESTIWLADKNKEQARQAAEKEALEVLGRLED